MRRRPGGFGDRDGHDQRLRGLLPADAGVDAALLHELHIARETIKKEADVLEDKGAPPRGRRRGRRFLRRGAEQRLHIGVRRRDGEILLENMCERGALGMALHEIIHFVWFRAWQERFRDSQEEYERPSLKWILSEMAVDPIMRDPRLSQINPYFADGCVYDYFYKMTVADRPVLEVLDELMRTRSMDSFMDDAFALLSEHESEIRRQIAQAENG